VQDSAATPATANAVLNLGINQSPPAAPTGLVATATSQTQVVLTWNDNANNESSVFIERATDSGFTAGFTSVRVVGSTLATYTDNTVVVGATYFYRVQTANAVAFSATYSNTATVTVPTFPLAITTASLVNGSVNTVYNQAVVAANGTAPLLWSATGLPTGLSIDPATGTISGTPANVVPSGPIANFSVSVTVQDSAATPATANAVLNLSINQSPPAAPTGLVATAIAATQVDLTWIDNANNESSVFIERATDTGFTVGFTSVRVVGSTLTTYTDNTVVTGITYFYRVKTANAVAYSASYSNTATATTP
jgi:titin